jgi:hypothetical protein
MRESQHHEHFEGDAIALAKLLVKDGGHWFSLMGTFLPFEIITYAI